MDSPKTSKKYSGVKFNTHRLAMTRDTTQRTMDREIQQEADRQGRSISLIAGARKPTERYVNGEWVKV